MAVEVEDDVFFADLSKQIAMLIMDDEEEFPVQCPPLPVQGLPCMPRTMMLPSSYGYEEMAIGRERRGTGVFIPLSTAPRRKKRPRRSTWVDNRNDFHGQKLGMSATVASPITITITKPHRPKSLQELECAKEPQIVISNDLSSY
ncbi:unnamed protein product [Musa acuminata subsp. malaccensis]|uniref:(wild Malaysian banana) hypothetical protein n=1 Tax=Musa acuminata subsp. malaccensis TaxID=214687 RepID=A0A804KR75_MUSAM|nr:PREDICTED: uncharacterized protein LOC104000068 [Musa acuminata subsp. malaccensis]CAG1852151.1 unnamed protein product [Musa acuminata subsp. malaccensis]